MAATVATLAGGASAAVIKPTGVAVRLPNGTTDLTTGTFKDDVYLQSIIFGSGAISGGDSFRAVKRFEVLTGATNINAEFGDNDTGSDGDDNPFVKAGLATPGQTITTAIQETTDAAKQNAALLNVFNSRSLTEMADGESGAFSFKVLFQNALNDDNPDALDQVPELLFVERGGNDTGIRVEAIIGGTFENPIYSNAFTFGSTDFWKSTILVDTKEITGGQLLSFGGIDFNEFGLGRNKTVYGLRVTATNGGADLNGMFLQSTDPTRFLPALDDPAPVPVPASLPLLLGAVGGLGLLRRRRTA